MTNIKVLQMPDFKRTYKRLHNNQKISVDQAILDIVKNPLIGEVKKGDLSGVYVYKFKSHHQQFLLAYEYDSIHRILLALGVHENFYRDLKRNH